MLACIRRDQPNQLETLSAFLTPDATFEHQPILDIAQAPKFHRNGSISVLPHGPQLENSARYRVKAANPPHNIFTLTRSDSGPHPHCWLISDISNDPSNKPSDDTS